MERWATVSDDRRCEVCELLDGTLWPVGSGPQPGFHDHCRCERVPAVGVVPSLRPLDRHGVPLTAAMLLSIALHLVNRRSLGRTTPANPARYTRKGPRTIHRDAPRNQSLLDQASDDLAGWLDSAQWHILAGLNAASGYDPDGKRLRRPPKP